MLGHFTLILRVLFLAKSNSSWRKTAYKLLGLTPCIGLSACGEIDLDPLRACKPVVPQVIIDFGGRTEVADGFKVLIQYDENVSARSYERGSSRNVRIASCQVNGGSCISSRARYEWRFEGERVQSIQLRELNGNGNPIVGGVRWKGASYPDRVKIVCDMSDLDARRPCVLNAVEYAAAPNHSGEDRKRAIFVERHDKCRP